MGPFKSLFVLMVSNGTLWPLTTHYTSLSVVVGFYTFLCIHMGSYESLQVPKRPYEFLWLFKVLYRSL